ncbi:hypothetical protein AGIG_G13586 [Arapaima gigas]
MYHMEFPSPGTLCTARSINSHPMYACAHVEPKNSSRLSCGVQIGPWRPRRAAEARPSGEEQSGRTRGERHQSRHKHTHIKSRHQLTVGTGPNLEDPGSVQKTVAEI